MPIASDQIPDYMLPPQAVEAEMAVIGAMLTDNTVIDAVTLIIQPSDFYREPHRVIYLAILDLQTDGDVADIITVNERLKHNGRLDEIGGVTYLMACSGKVTSAANAEHHAAMIREKSLLRGVVETGTTLTQEAMQGQSTATDIVSRALSLLDRLAGNAIRSMVQSVKDLTGRMTELIDAAHQRKGSLTGIKSGIVGLDDVTMGFQPGRMYVFGAPTGIGKTTLMLNCLYHATMAGQKRALVFSLEMSAEELAFRLIAIHTAIPHRRIEHGLMDDRDWQRYTTRAEWMTNDRLMIVDDCNVTAEDIMATARREQRERGLDLVAVDYLQLIRWAGHQATDRHLQVAAQGRTMKRLARQLNIPVLVVTQLNDDLRARESRDVENDSDFFLTLSESDPQCQNSEGFPLVGTIRKNRSGPRKELNLIFNKPIQRITDEQTTEF